MKLSLNAAAKHYKISKSTLSEALNSGRLSAAKDARGRWQIDPSEMDRVFPLNTSERTKHRNPNTEANPKNHHEIEALNAKVAMLEQMVEAEQARNEDLRADRDEWRKQAQTLAITQERPAAPTTGTGFLARLFG
jgi:hypothetical protein